MPEKISNYSGRSPLGQVLGEISISLSHSVSPCISLSLSYVPSLTFLLAVKSCLLHIWICLDICWFKKMIKVSYVILDFHEELGCSCGAMIKAMDCRIVVSEFILPSCYYVHFRANTLEKRMNPLILPAMG